MGRTESQALPEAVADYELWIWHAFGGMPGSANDIDILNRSHIFDSFIRGEAINVPFRVGGREYDLKYYLAAGI